ncbi:MAG: Ig-like domain-containing protein [Hominilimicola sp.]
MNNKKKLLSIITALAITASAFTGFAVTAIAENTDEQPISADSEITLADETTSTEAVTEDEQSEAVELADDSDVYFEQNYDAADASVDWVSPNMQSAITLVDDGNGGKMVDTTHIASANSRGQYLLFGDLAAGSKYVVEFDMAFAASDSQGSQFAVLGSDYAYKEKNANYGCESGYILKMDAPANAASWAITNSTKTIPTGIENMYHYKVVVNGTTAYLTVTKGSETVVDNEIMPVNGAGGIKGLYYVSGRYTAHMQIDNIKLRKPTDSEIPDTTYYTATINTTRYATMVTDDNTYYADATGKIEIPLLTSGTEINYTLKKVGYNDVTGTISIDSDNVTQDKPLALKDSDVLFMESDFGNKDGAYISASGSRGDSISLGSENLSDLTNISVDMNFAGFGSYLSGSQKVWYIDTDGGKLVGLQFSANGLYAWTGWTGSAGMNVYDDTGKYTNGALLSNDLPSGDFTVNFVVDKNSKAITVSYNDTSVSLPYTINATAVTGLGTGLYRYLGELQTKEIKATTPNRDYLAINGVSGVAKVSGKIITREYQKSETVINDGETFTWALSRKDGKAMTGITIENGVLSVADTAEPGKITITCTGSSSASKTASKDVVIGDFQSLSLKADGPQAYTSTDNEKGKYVLTSAVDSFGDEVLSLLSDVKWTSSNTDVATITEAGELTVVGSGSTTVTATVTNGTAVSKITIPVTVDTYYINADATGDSTVVDTTKIVSGDNIKKYLVTTATADGTLVKQTQVDAADVVAARVTKTAENGVKIIATYENGLLKGIVQADVEKGTEITAENTTTTKVFYWTSLAEMKPITLTTEATESKCITVDTTGAAKVEVAPIYETSMNTLVAIPSDSYNVTITANNGRRTDVYVNDQMMFNNINQGSDNWTIGRNVAESTDYTVHDIVVTQGYAKFNYRDDQSSGTTITNVKFSKSPSIVTRTKKVYVIGDSLVANYYGTAPEGKEGLVRTGWGQVLQNYISGAEVVNLGNSGAWATGMKADAFTNVLGSAQPGDIMVLESGYNDKVHSNEADMKAAVTDMLTTANDMGLTTFLVTPNASYHDYEEDVIYSAAIRTVAEEVTSTNLIDLAKKSYAFLNDKYGALDNAARRYVLVGDKDNAGIYNNAVWNEDNSKISGDKGLHSTNNAANCWAAIIAQGLYDNEATRNVVDTNYKYTFNDGTNDISVGVSTSTTTD